MGSIDASHSDVHVFCYCSRCTALAALLAGIGTPSAYSATLAPAATGINVSHWVLQNQYCMTRDGIIWRWCAYACQSVCITPEDGPLVLDWFTHQYSVAEST